MEMDQFLTQLSTIVAKFSNFHVLVIGDVGLDEYIQGEVHRMSPEAPVPVLEVESKSVYPGMSGNVARNIISLGGEATLLSLIGNDETGSTLKSTLLRSGVGIDNLVVDNGRPTTRKTRIMNGQHHIVRVDNESKKDISKKIEEIFFARFKKLLSKVDAVIIEDYNKGLLTSSLIKSVMRECNLARTPVFVDPNKSKSVMYYHGADVITPNEEEARILFDHRGAINELGKTDLAFGHFNHIVVTQGKDGMTLLSKDKTLELPTFAQQVFDVTGAGDTVIAALTLGYLSGMPIDKACVFANLAAGIVVGKIGSASCNEEEIMEFASKWTMSW